MCEHTINWRKFLTMRKMSTTIQWHSLLTLWEIRRPYESDDVRSFSRKPFSCSTSAKPQAMFQVTTQTESVDQMCVQYATKVLKSCGVLDNHLTFQQLSNHELNCTQDKRYLLAGMLFAQKTEENLLQVDASEIRRLKLTSAKAQERLSAEKPYMLILSPMCMAAATLRSCPGSLGHWALRDRQQLQLL